MNQNNQLPSMCITHNQPIIMSDPKLKQEHLCTLCIKQLTGNIPIDQLQQNFLHTINKVIQENENQIEYLQKLVHDVMDFQKVLTTSFNQITEVLLKQIENIKTSSTTNFQYQQNFDIRNTIDEQKLNHNQFKAQLLEQVNNLQKKFSLIEKFFIEQGDFSDYQKKIEYQLIGQLKTTEETAEAMNYSYGALAISQELGIVFVTLGNEIIIYSFLNGVIDKELQRLTDHQDVVRDLYFLKLSKQLFSIDGRFIKFWKQDENNYWISQNLSIDQQSNYYKILMNREENLLILSTSDFRGRDYYSYLYFYLKIEEKWQLLTQVHLESVISNSISLNQKQNKLITCGHTNNIYILEQLKNKKWKIFQKIQATGGCGSVQFLARDQFVCQLQSEDSFEVYDFDENHLSFELISQYKIRVAFWPHSLSTFPCQYNDELQILVVKSHRLINIFKVNPLGMFYKIQTIQFDHTNFNGKLSDDGQYLINFDREYQEIEVRKLNYLT